MFQNLTKGERTVLLAVLGLYFLVIACLVGSIFYDLAGTAWKVWHIMNVP